MVLDLVNIVNKILAFGTIGCQIFIILAIIYILLPYKKSFISDFFTKNGIKYIITNIHIFKNVEYTKVTKNTPFKLDKQTIDYLNAIKFIRFY